EILSDEAELFYGEVNFRRYTFRITDQWGNLVPDGTLVDIDVAGDLIIQQSQAEVRDGVAYVDIAATEKFSATNTLAVSVGSYVYEERIVNVSSPSVDIIASTSVDTNEIIPFTVAVTPAVAGVDVFLHSDIGILSSTVITTNDAGMASGNLKAIAHPRSGKLSATIGFSARDVHDITVQGASGLIINTPVMV